MTKEELVIFNNPKVRSKPPELVIGEKLTSFKQLETFHTLDALEIIQAHNLIPDGSKYVEKLLSLTVGRKHIHTVIADTLYGLYLKNMETVEEVLRSNIFEHYISHLKSSAFSKSTKLSEKVWKIY